MIEIDNLCFRYGNGPEVLKDVSFRTEPNTVISILGPNGTGKTTFLKCMCGLLRPTSGKVTVEGTDVSRLRGRDLAKEIGFVPQSTPASRVSVFDAVLVGRRPYIEWFATQADIDKVSEIIDSMGMSHLSLRYLDEISGGEFQKVQIARAIVQEPSVLILDEPTNNLDIANQHRTMHMVTNAVRSRGICTIMTMHDINLAVHYSDKFLFFDGGEIAAYGGPEVITEELIQRVYGIEMDVIEHRGVPIVLPRDSPRYTEEIS